MKKSLILAVTAIAALSACNKETVDTPIDDTKAPVFTATIEPETKTVLVEGTTAGKLTKVNWEDTDEVSVSGVVYTVAPGSDASTATLTKKTSSEESPVSPFKAYYPASMYNAGTATLPATYTYTEGNFNMPMYAENTETSLAFKNICAVLAITVPSTQMSSVTSITVSSDKQMNGAFTATAEGVLTFAEKTLEDADKKVTITFSAAKAIANESSETFYIAIPANTYAYLQIDVTDGTNTKTMKTKAASITVERNKIYPITFANNYDPNLLAGEFSVSATKKVQFTKGNLYCNASISPATFGIEEHQYDFPTSYPTLSGDVLWNCDHVGHFFWKKWEVYSSTDDYAYRDMPYYATCGTGDISTTDVFWCGEAHPLEVAGTQGLYVLSADEWNYLLNEEGNEGGRTGNRYALAKYKDNYGILIFPDGYTGIISGDGIGEVNNAWNETNPSANIPDDTWTAMEAAGVVFLPSAGYRNEEAITGGYCRYWSSTPYDVTTEKNYLYKAYCLNVINYDTNQSSLWSKGKEQRSFGSSIRLVKTVE